MGEPAQHLLLALKAPVENHVAFELHVGNLDRDCLSGSQIDRLEDRRHAAARDHLGKLELIEGFADADLAHGWMSRARRATVWARTLTLAPDARQSESRKPALAPPNSTSSASQQAAQSFLPAGWRGAQAGLRHHGKDRDAQVVGSSPLVGRVDESPGGIRAAVVASDEFDLRVAEHVVKPV